MISPTAGITTHVIHFRLHARINAKLMINASQPAPLALKKSTPVKNKHNTNAMIQRLMRSLKKTNANNGGITTTSRAPMVFHCSTGPMVLGNPENKLKTR